MAIDVNNINHLNQRPDQRTIKDVNQNEIKQPVGQTATSTAQDTVQVTEMAKQLDKLKSTMPTEPPMDTEKVESLKQSIKLGTFDIDFKKIADDFLDKFRGHL